MAVHVIAGPPCAGKTTFARNRGGNVIDLDDIEEELGGIRYAAISQVRAEALKIRDVRIAEAFESDEDTWLIHTAPSQEKLRDYLMRGASVRVIDPGRDVCMERAKDRPPHTPQVIDKWYKSFPFDAGSASTTVGAFSRPGGTDFPGGMMSEEAVQQEAAAVEEAPETVEPEGKTFSEAYVKQLREEAAGYRVKLKEIEDSEKSELQKATEAAETAQRELAATKSEAARLRIAAKHGIGEDHLDFLTGADEDELEAKAVKLAALINTTTTEPAPKKGAWAPFDPDEGRSPASNSFSAADAFAAAVEGHI